MSVIPLSSTATRIPPPPRRPVSPPAEAPAQNDADLARGESAPPLSPAALASPTTMRIVALVDPVLDQLGYAATSLYVETYWLSVLGPSTTWLLRRLVAGLEEHPDGYDIDLQDTAKGLGLGMNGGRHAPFLRALVRLGQFGAAHSEDGELRVRRRLPPLSPRHIARLPESLQASHLAWQSAEREVSPAERVRRRARQLALSLYELGEESEEVERHLHRWRFHPGLASEAAAWARDRHRAAHAHLLTSPESDDRPARAVDTRASAIEGAEQFDEGGGGEAGAAAGPVAVVGLGPAGAGDVDVDPRRAPHELL